MIESYWSVLGEKATGTSHTGHGAACQDAFGYRTFGGAFSKWLVIAVADGAGSASHSEIGAGLACEELVKRIEIGESCLLPTEQNVLSIFHDVRLVLLAEAERLQVQPRELACTLLLAVIGPESVAFAQVGDGAIVYYDGQEYRTAFWPEPLEYANATDFLTDDNLAKCFSYNTINSTISELAVMTDGLQRLALDFSAKQPHAEFFHPLFQAIKISAKSDDLSTALKAFLNSPIINERTDDDKTLVLAVRSQ